MIQNKVIAKKNDLLNNQLIGMGRGYSEQNLWNNSSDD